MILKVERIHFLMGPDKKYALQRAQFPMMSMPNQSNLTIVCFITLKIILY